VIPGSSPGTSRGAGSLRTPGRLEAAVEAETPLGGRSRAWAPVAALWLDLSATAMREAAAEQQRPVRIETATAVARDDPRATPGQRLTVGEDPPWRVLDIDRAQPTPGRMRLRLERVA